MSFQSVAGALFSEDKNEVLLILRRDVPVWVLPGGGINAGESPEEAVIREIFEETGVCVKVKRCVGAYHPINRLAKSTLLYECTYLSGTLSLSSETKGVRYIPLDKLPPLPPPYKEWIEEAAREDPMVVKKLTTVTYARLLKELVLHPLLVLRFLLSRFKIPWNS
jgi:ADP-ribose pyrophosphatase YjhB (NUDIX family)